MIKTSTILFMALLESVAYGEYRVYQYYVRPKVKNINPTNAQLVTSTLDPISYSAYHGGSESIEVNLMRSWMCMGNTANQSVCTISEGKEFSQEASAPVADSAPLSTSLSTSLPASLPGSLK